MVKITLLATMSIPKINVFLLIVNSFIKNMLLDLQHPKNRFAKT